MKLPNKKRILQKWEQKIREKTYWDLEDYGKQKQQIIHNNLNRYITILLEETDYNPKEDIFYESISGFKYTAGFLSEITTEYILEHPEYFLKT